MKKAVRSTLNILSFLFVMIICGLGMWALIIGLFAEALIRN